MLTAECDEAAVLAYASALAVDCQASLTVVEVLAESTPETERGLFSRPAGRANDREQEERLEQLVSGLRDRLHVQTKVLVGRPSQAVIQEVVDNGHDLMLKPAEGTSSAGGSSFRRQ